MPPDFSFEASAQADGHTLICGVDEAGRGPWAGPVCAAAVIFNQANLFPGLDDSKKLTEAKREALFPLILASTDFGVGLVSAAEIDQINILQATFLAMKRAVAALKQKPTLALVDGNRAPKLSCAAQVIIGGDGRSLSIAAASRVAAGCVADAAVARTGWCEATNRPPPGRGARRRWPWSRRRASPARP